MKDLKNGTKALLITLAFFVGSTAIAKSKTGFGIHGGLTFMNTNISASNSDTGFVLGIDYEAPILKSVLTIQSELNYVRNGAENNSFGGFGTTRFSFIELPVMLKVGIPLGVARITAFAGPKVAILINTSTTLSGVTIQDSDRQSVEFGSYIGAGVEFSRLVLSARYVLGWTDLDNSANSWKFQGVQVLAGLKL